MFLKCFLTFGLTRHGRTYNNRIFLVSDVVSELPNHIPKGGHLRILATDSQGLAEKTLLGNPLP